MGVKLLIAFTLFALCAGAQDISGKWLAKSQVGGSYFTPLKVVIELQEHADGVLSGVTHFYYAGNYYEHFRVSGKIDRKKNQVTFSEDSLINYHTQPGAEIISGTYYLGLSASKKKIMMKGVWKPHTAHNATINYSMEREINETVVDTVKLPDKPLITNRIDKVMNVLELDSKEADSVRIDVYDNGEVDGDTVTVYMNKNIVISKQRISEKPITFITGLSREEPIAQIRMIAENLGSIPPNTALMIITTRKNRYTVRLSSDLKSNGVVELFLKQ